MRILDRVTDKLPMVQVRHTTCVVSRSAGMFPGHCMIVVVVGALWADTGIAQSSVGMVGHVVVA